MKLGLITDIHEQTTSLERVLSMAHSLGCHEVACLGDITGFDPELFPPDSARSASSCIRLVRENCRWVVGGNHDREEPSVNRNLSNIDSEYLKQLPESLIIIPEQSRILLSHYLYPDFTGSSMVFVHRLNQMECHYEFMVENGISMAFAGHDHPAGVGFGYPKPYRWLNGMRRAFHYMPFHRYELDGQLMVCLLPALATRSGRPAFSVWDTVSRTLDTIQLAH